MYLNRKLAKLTYTDAQGNSMPYRLLKPKRYLAARKYPLVIFLHGSEERGTDNHTPIRIRNGAYEFMVTAHKYAYFMVVPQCPPHTGWSGKPIRLVLGLIQHIRDTFSIDPDRIYATGLSMGAMGMWEMVIRQPETFAAGISVCGWHSTTQIDRIKDIPFLVFHGSRDRAVPVEGSRKIVNALQEVGGSVEYIEYQGADHCIWEQTFTDQHVIGWLFKQSKRRKI
jgi:predicted peptidase